MNHAAQTSAGACAKARTQLGLKEECSCYFCPDFQADSSRTCPKPGIDPAPSTAMIAIAASLGIPFVISTPPNVMIYGEGGITFSDLAVPGLILMILGCILVSTTGPLVLNLLGLP